MSSSTAASRAAGGARSRVTSLRVDVRSICAGCRQGRTLDIDAEGRTLRSLPGSSPPRCTLTVDVLVFGPHADDIEIGLGGTIARHVARRPRVGLCDLTRAELSSNGTPEQRLDGGSDAATRPRRGLAGESRTGPTAASTAAPDQVRGAVELIRRARARAVAIPYWHDRHPDHRATPAQLLQQGGLQERAAPLRNRHRAHGGPSGSAITSSTTARRPRSSIDVSAHYETKRAALACYRSQFADATTGRWRRASTRRHSAS